MITTSRADLYAALKLAASIAPAKHSLPLLKCVRLDSSGVLSATDLICSLSVQLDCTQTKTGAVAIDASSLLSLVGGAPGDSMSISSSGEIKSGKAKYKLPVQDPKHWPSHTGAPPKPDPINSEVLLDLISKTLFAVAKDENRINLAGVFLCSAEGWISAYSTDGHRCCKAMAKADIKGWQGIIPRSGCEAIQRICAQGPEVSVGMGGGYFWVRQDKSLLSVKLIDATPPPVGMIIDQSRPIAITLHRVELLKSLKRVSQMATQDVPVRLAVRGAATGLSCVSAIGSAEDEILSIDSTGDITIGFNHKYAIELLMQMSAETVKLSFVSPLEPFMIEEENYQGIILPMRINA